MVRVACLRVAAENNPLLAPSHVPAWQLLWPGRFQGLQAAVPAAILQTADTTKPTTKEMHLRRLFWVQRELGHTNRKLARELVDVPVTLAWISWVNLLDPPTKPLLWSRGSPKYFMVKNFLLHNYSCRLLPVFSVAVKVLLLPVLGTLFPPSQS